MTKKATLDQGLKVLGKFAGISTEQLQRWVDLGVFDDMSKVDPSAVGLTREQFRLTIGFAPQVAHIVNDRSIRIVQCPTYKLHYTGRERAVELLAEAAGLQRKYVLVNDDNFPVPARAPREFEMCLFPPALVNEWDKHGNSVIAGCGFRNSNTAELLALAVAHPTFQEVFHIIACGQSDRDGKRFPYLAVECSKEANRGIFTIPKDEARQVTDGTHAGWLIAATKLKPQV